jgi:hypothetical protein
MDICMDFRADDKSREFPVIIRGKPGDYTRVFGLTKHKHVEPEAVAELEDRIKARVPSFVFRYSLSISDGPVGVRGHVKNTQILLFHHPHKRILVVHNDSSTIGVFFLRGIHKPFASKCREMREKEKGENYHDSFAYSYG